MKRQRRVARKVERLVRICLADIENLELAAEHMTEAADAMSHRGTKALAWQRAFCKRLRREMNPNRD